MLLLGFRGRDRNQNFFHKDWSGFNLKTRICSLISRFSLELNGHTTTSLISVVTTVVTTSSTFCTIFSTAGAATGVAGWTVTAGTASSSAGGGVVGRGGGTSSPDFSCKFVWLNFEWTLYFWLETYLCLVSLLGLVGLLLGISLLRQTTLGKEMPKNSYKMHKFQKSTLIHY